MRRQKTEQPKSDAKVPVHVRLPQDVIDVLKQRAKDARMEPSTLARRLIEAALGFEATKA